MNGNGKSVDEKAIAWVGNRGPQDDAGLICWEEATKVLGGMSRATFYNLIKRGVIPKGKKLFGTRSVRWSKTELAELANQL